MIDITSETNSIASASRGEDVRDAICSAEDKLSGALLPEVTAADAGKILKVSTSGKWVLGEVT